MRAGRWWMLGVTCLSVVVVNLDLTILNIALPDISGALHAGTGDRARCQPHRGDRRVCTALRGRMVARQAWIGDVCR